VTVGDKTSRNDGETRPRRVVSMRLIVSAAAAALVALSVIGVGSVSEKNTRELLMFEVEARLLLEASNLANLSADALLDDFPELTLNPVVSDIREKRPALAVVAVLDHQGAIKGHADVRMYGLQLAVLDSLAPVETTQSLDATEVFLGNDRLLVAAVDAQLADGQKVGRAVVGLRRDTVEAMVTRARQQMVLVSAALLIVGLLASVLLMRVLLRSVATLRKGIERIGQGDLNSPMNMNDFTELGLLADTVDEMAARISASQRDMVEKERLAHEMDLARDIQLSLLPDTYTAAGDFVIEGTYQAAAEVGGDYFDVFELPDGRVGCMIADVAGKGLAGCLVTSMLAVLMRSLRDRYESPRELLVALENGLVDQLAPGVFVTAFYGILEAETGVMTYASAAHSPLLVYRAESADIESRETRGIPIGAVRGGMLGKTLDDETIILDPGDFILQYTDGLNEAPHAETEEEFGFDRVREIILREVGNGRRSVLTSLQDATMQWCGDRPQSDDLTLLAISREGAGHLKIVDRLSMIESDQDLLAVMGKAPHLTLDTDLDELDSIGGWLRDMSCTAGLAAEERELLETGLYEICANIVEHGHVPDAARILDVWWRDDYEDAPGEGDDDDRTRIRGHFLIRDRGDAFDPRDWSPPDLNDRVTRMKGRGLGMMVVDKLVSDKTYLPKTAVGNLYLVRFNALLGSGKMEDIHV
jgi:serine phosphatase RsbU (regulator of sigma subunit)/anti-sigma regulatory factor (Ser/Thr protein kinase)